MKHCIWFLMPICLLAAAQEDRITLPLVVEGKPAASVVVGGTDAVLLAAARDLRYYVERITGAKLEVYDDADAAPSPALHLGATALFEHTAAARESLVLDGFVAQRVGEDLIVTGTYPTSAANGVYTLLQDNFGVRWYYTGPLWEVVPSAETLVISLPANAGPDAYIENPGFPGRTLWGAPPSPEFGRRMRLTDAGVPLPYVGVSHDLARVVPADTYFASHPEYFALQPDGRRSADHLCLTHPDMFDLWMDYVRKGGSAFGVNDNTVVCHCDDCQAVDGDSEPYQGMPNISESFCQLMARVAARTAVEFPKRRLGMFAYQVTNAPPKTVDYLGDNVGVVLCQDTSQYFDTGFRDQDYAMQRAWTDKAGAVRMYDYVGIDYWTPRYFPRILAEQLRHMKDAGLVGFGTHTPSMAGSSMPMFYLMYQMLWNSELDHAAVIDEMIDDLYIEAADPVRAYYQHWETCWMRQQEGVWFYGMDDFFGEMRIYRPQDIERGQELLARAATLARDEQVRQRVAFLQRDFDFTRESARVYFASRTAIEQSPPRRFEDALRRAYDVVDAWQAHHRARVAAQALPEFPPSGWYSKTYRVRAWGLRQLVRDAVRAPLVRWITANEAKLDPDELALVERTFAAAALAGLEAVEDDATADHGYKPRHTIAPALRSASLPRADTPPPLTAAGQGWPFPRVDATPWMFSLRPDGFKQGKYDEPVQELRIDPPDPNNLSAHWTGAWDKDALYLRVRVRDNDHKQSQPAPEIWRADSLQIAIDPHRDRMVMDDKRMHSWTYQFGGHHGEELEFGIALVNDKAVVHVWQAPERKSKDGKITVAAGRHDNETIYEARVDWALLNLRPKPGMSLGLGLVVNDVDDDRQDRMTAEYGAGVATAKRKLGLAAVRLR